MGYFDMKILITVLAIIFTTSSGKKYRFYEDEEKIDSEFNKTIDVNRNIFDLRGSLRRTFGFKAFLINPDRSNICSPISALMPLGKLALGAHGKSLRELNRAIGVSSDQSSNEDEPSRELKKHMKRLVKNLERMPGVILDVANRLYVSDKQHLYSNYNKLTTKIFKTSVKKVNFDDPSRVAESINNWVASETHGMIPHIVHPNDVSPPISLVIVNAVYFAGKWIRPFRSLSMGVFHSPTGDRNVPMMTDTFVYEYHYSEVLSSQMIRIPYEGEEASFLIVLPRDRNGLKNLLPRLEEKPHLLREAMLKFKMTNIKLTMPKFKIVSEWNLVELYKEIGLSTIFKRRKSELNGIVRNDTIYVSSAIHKAVVDVTEIGTDAAASSAMTVFTSAVVKTDFTADHPFLFYILGKSQQLFMGMYV